MIRNRRRSSTGTVEEGKGVQLRDVSIRDVSMEPVKMSNVEIRTIDIDPSTTRSAVVKKPNRTSSLHGGESGGVDRELSRDDAAVIDRSSGIDRELEGGNRAVLAGRGTASDQPSGKASIR